MTEETGPVLKAFRSDKLQAESPTITSDTGFELLCTYNWAQTATPSIYVPGMLTSPPVRSISGNVLIPTRGTSVLALKKVADDPT